MVAKIAVSASTFAIDKPYSYRVPGDMQLCPGMRVMVPFGRGNSRTEGVVIRLEQGSEDGLKTVERCLDAKPLISEYMLQMAAFLRDRYFCTLFDCLRAMLPAPLWFQTKITYRLTEDQSWQQGCTKKDARALLELIRELGGEAEESMLRKTIPQEDALHSVLQYLLRKKWIHSENEFLRKLGDKTEKIATLAVSPEEALEYAAHRPKSAAMQKSVLELMCSIGCVSVKELCYYTGAATATVKRLEKLGFLELSERPVLRCKDIRPATLTGPLVLNEKQQEVFVGLQDQMQKNKPGTALLYGVTGSGKTSVYLKLIQICLEQGKSAMLLVPEIALTPQLLSLLAAHFGNQVAIQHSSLSAGERMDQWKRIRNGDAKVVVGTRSAVFAPAQNLGLIILDEEQEHSYKSENIPRYDAREVALWRGLKENALVLFGSATPTVETMYRAKQGIYRLYTLRSRYNGASLPAVQIVDMREEIKAGNDLSFSNYLLDMIGKTRSEGKQTILFLNRRGASRALVCIDCREAPECNRCSVKLVYHSANERLMCHHCGHSQPAPQRCPVCGGPLKQVGIGTQKAQQELRDAYPDMEVARMDTDSVNAVNTHEAILSRFTKERIPVLLGTQMVAKGLNLPDVTLVGVLDADAGLYCGSYRAAETTFNMLTQVVGRAGRGDMPGQAVIQTMVPEHPVIQMAARQDYDSFYELELGLREMQKFPPFGDVASVTFVGMEEARVLRGAAKFQDSLNACLKEPAYQDEKCQILGPAPCAVPKINYNFRYRLTLRCQMSKNLRHLVAHLLRQFMLDGANRGVSAFADVNGFEE